MLPSLVTSTIQRSPKIVDNGEEMDSAYEAAPLAPQVHLSSSRQVPMSEPLEQK